MQGIVGFMAVMGLGTAAAAPAKLKKRMVESVPVANASEIPALAGLLDKAGWTPTPELSGVFQVGRIFKDDGTGHSLMVRDCFDAQPGSDPYTSAEVVSHLQAGVRVGFGIGVKGSASLVRKVNFDVPVHHTLERLAMAPNPECTAMLDTATEAERGSMYAVQEVLTAVITEQRCGRLDASGQFVVVTADAELEAVCSQQSHEPVAVAYRSVPVGELTQPAESPQVGLKPPVMTMIDGAEGTNDGGCHWGDIESVHSTMTTLTINGKMMDVRGVETRAWITTELQRCGYREAGDAFNDWRASRRTTNIACATGIGCYPFGVGIWSAVKAKQHRLRMEQALLSEPDLVRKASSTVIEPPQLTEELASAFVQDCVEAWSKRDDALWDQIVDEAFFPLGSLPVLLNEEKEAQSDVWMSFPGIKEWLTDHSVAEVSRGLRAVGEITSKELRDYRGMSLEELRTTSFQDSTVPKARVQTLALGLDFNGDGEITSEETTRVHQDKGALYWEPFGW